MPLVDLAPAPSAEENFKARVAYGLPKAYPLAINGLRGDGVNVVPTNLVNQGYDDRTKPALRLPVVGLLKSLLMKPKPPDATPTYFHPVHDTEGAMFGLGKLGCGCNSRPSYDPGPPDVMIMCVAEEIDRSGLSGLKGLGCGGNCGCSDCQAKHDDIFAPVGNPGPTVNGLGGAFTDFINIPSLQTAAESSQPGFSTQYAGEGDQSAMDSLVSFITNPFGSSSASSSTPPVAPSPTKTVAPPRQNTGAPVVYGPQPYPGTGPQSYPPGQDSYKPSASNAPAGSALDTFNKVWDKVTGTFAPLFAPKQGGGGKGKTIVKQTPDYTTIAVVVGGALLGSALLLAISRKKS